jgi:Domain of unknown function (DUF5085)
MQIYENSFAFTNVLTLERTSLKGEWMSPFYDLERIVIGNGIYQDGPIFFSIEPVENEEKFGHFKYYVPLNTPIDLKQDGSEFSFEEEVIVENALFVRHINQEEDLDTVYQRMKRYAEENNIKIATRFYCVCLELYGDYVCDIFVPRIDVGEKQ